MRKFFRRALFLITLGIIVFQMDLTIMAKSNIVINGVDIGYAVGDYFSTTGRACGCHGKNMCVPPKSGCTCVHVSGTAQCYGFALWCEDKIYGCNDVSNPGKFSSLGSAAAGTLTGARVKELISYILSGVKLSDPAVPLTVAV